MAAQNPSGCEDLSLIPRAVRDKLDRVGIKLHLHEWLLLSLKDRRNLCEHRCDEPSEVTAYAALVERLVVDATGRAPDRVVS